MGIGEILAYLTLALLVVSYFMPTMIWLRAIATAAAIVIVAYGAVTGHWIAAVIGAAIAAINLWRLYEMRKMVAVTRAATAASGAPITVDWILPFMRPVVIPKGTVLFRRGAEADAMYFIQHGKVRFDEIDMEIGKGSLFGEIGLFSDDKRRTTSATVVEDSELLQISGDRVRELYYQNPDFGFFLVGLITRRLMDDAKAGTLKP